jgi:hypothetical protein
MHVRVVCPRPERYKVETKEKLKNYTDNIADHLNTALNLALQMQQLAAETEGDSDLYRKLAYYLTPNLSRWVSGAQAGNMQDLRELFARREAQARVLPQPAAKEGNGHEVLTAPKKN